jgi:hypothetical protein
MSHAQRDLQPWYREPWPWLVMAGPAIVVVAGIATAVIAWRTSDGLVSDDYYKQGLVINQTLQRDEKAQSLGMSAQVLVNPAHDRIRLMLSGRAQGPDALQLRLLHPTMAGRDRNVTLKQVSAGLYEGSMPETGSGTWRLQLEDINAGWRLVGAWRSNQNSVTLGRPGSQ